VSYVSSHKTKTYVDSAAKQNTVHSTVPHVLQQSNYATVPLTGRHVSCRHQRQKWRRLYKKKLRHQMQPNGRVAKSLRMPYAKHQRQTH